MVALEMCVVKDIYESVGGGVTGLFIQQSGMQLIIAPTLCVCVCVGWGCKCGSMCSCINMLSSKTHYLQRIWQSPEKAALP